MKGLSVVAAALWLLAAAMWLTLGLMTYVLLPPSDLDSLLRRQASVERGRAMCGIVTGLAALAQTLVALLQAAAG